MKTREYLALVKALSKYSVQFKEINKTKKGEEVLSWFNAVEKEYQLLLIKKNGRLSRQAAEASYALGYFEPASLPSLYLKEMTVSRENGIYSYDLEGLTIVLDLESHYSFQDSATKRAKLDFSLPDIEVNKMASINRTQTYKGDFKFSFGKRKAK
jgi:hypothetical protein